MGQDALGRDRPALADVAAEIQRRGQLLFGKIGQAAGMAGIGDLDADRAGVDVGFAGPVRGAGMPGAAAFRHELEGMAVLEDEVVRGHLRDRVAQPLQRFARNRHAGVVQDQHVRPPAGRAVGMLALAMVGRVKDLAGEAAVGRRSVGHGGQAGSCDRRRARPRSWVIASQAALIADRRRVAMATASWGRPRAISRSGWFSATRRR